MNNSNDVSLKVGFDIDRFTSELNKTNGLLNKWSSTIQSQILSAFTITGAVSLLTRGIQNAVQSMAAFEKEMSQVKAITGATGEEFKKLHDNSLNLAGSFKAIDIAKLETELGRLGFSTDEILKSTKTVIDLATATGEDLAKSAGIAGSTLRAFNLDASQMGRVGDVMAAAFNKSALGLENFGEAIKYVAPVAAAAGLSLEQVSAMLGVLADNGIRGSMAGTSLRKIISDLGQGAAPVLNEKLQEMAKAGMSGAQAMDEVGRTAYASLLILSKNTDKVDEATKAYSNANGELQKMSSIMQDNLQGDWDKFGAALDKIVQGGGEGGISGFLRGITQNLTDQLNVWNSADISIWEKLFGSEQDYKTYLKRIEDTKATAKTIKELFAVSYLKSPLTPEQMKAEGARQNPGGGSVTEQVGIIEKLNVQLKEAEENKKKAFSYTEIMRYRDEVEKIRKQLEAIDQLGKTDNKTLKQIQDLANGMGGSVGGTPQNKDIFAGLGKLSEGMSVEDRLNTIKNAVGNFSEYVQGHANKIRNAFVGMASNIASGIGQILGGNGNIEKLLLGTLGGVLVQLGEMALEIGAGLLAIQFALKTVNPFAAIAAGIGLIALGSYFTSQTASIGSNAGGNASGASYSGGRTTDSFNGANQTMNVNVTGVIRGNDLALVMAKNNYNVGRVGG